MTLKSDLNALAHELVKKARSAGEGTLLPKERVEIFKAASAWYLGVTKVDKKGTDDDPASPAETFDSLRKRLNGDMVQ